MRGLDTLQGSLSAPRRPELPRSCYQPQSPTSADAHRTSTKGESTKRQTMRLPNRSAGSAPDSSTADKRSRRVRQHKERSKPSSATAARNASIQPASILHGAPTLPVGDRSPV